MVSPSKPSAVNTSDASYSAVPNPDVASPDLNNLTASPDPNPRDSYLSPEGTNTPILGRDSMYMPAPSLMSRDSTHESLLRASSPGTNRNSWSSGAGLAAGASGLAGDVSTFPAASETQPDMQRRPNTQRGQSNLQHSSVGWNNTSNDRLSVSDEDDGQGHIAPAAAGAGLGAGAGAAALSEKPAWAREGGRAPKRSRKWLWIGLAVLALLVVGLAVGLGVG